MNLLSYYILVSIMPLLANYSGFLVSSWSSEELKKGHLILDSLAKIMFIVSLGLVLCQFKLIGFIILLIFILFTISKYFWKYEQITLLVYAIFIVLISQPLILTLIFLYFFTTTSISYYSFHQDKKVRFCVYPFHLINFLKRYWTFYFFMLLINTLILVLVII